MMFDHDALHDAVIEMLEKIGLVMPDPLDPESDDEVMAAHARVHESVESELIDALKAEGHLVSLDGEIL